MFVKQYTISYIDNLGGNSKADIIASSVDDAITKLGIAKHNLVAKEITLRLDNKVKVNIQLQILTRVLASISSGESVAQFLPSIVDDFRVLKSKKNLIKKEIEKGQTLAQLLNLLDMNPICVKIIENGTRGGKSIESIKDAKQFLRLEEKTQKSTSGTLKAQSLMILLSLFLIFGSPFFVVDFFDDIKNSGITFQANISTDILYSLADYGLYALFALFITISTAFIMSKQFLQLFGNVYPISLFQSIITTKKSILFLSIFTPLFKSGMTTEEVLESYLAIDLVNANKLKKFMLSGIALSDSIQNLDFSNTFKSGFKGFNNITNKKAKLSMLSELFDSLIEDIDNYSKQASALIKTTSNISNYSILLILVHGFMIPQLSLGVG